MNMKRKILFLTSQFGHGGVELSLLEAFKVIDPLKYDLTLLVRYDNAKTIHLIPEHVNVIINKDGHYYRSSKVIFFKVLTIIGRILRNKELNDKYNKKIEQYIHKKKVKNPYNKYFRKSSFDVVISYTVHTCTEMALEIPADKHYVFFHSGNAKFHKEITEKTFPKYDKIIAVGSGVQKILCAEFPQEKNKIVLLSNYIDMPLIIEKSKEPISAKKQKDKLYLCTASRIDKEKGIDILVCAALLLKNYNINFKWYVIGDGGEIGSIEQMIDKYQLNNYISLVGFQENPYPYMALCDIYVQPSYEEAQPLAILEAIALGKAIVSTDTLGGRAILDNGSKGIIVPVSPKGVADGIMKLIDNPDLKKSLEKVYTLDDNINEKKQYIRDWDILLS